LSQQFHLRIGSELRERLETLAAKSGRTVSGEILRLVDRGFDMDQIASPLTLDLFVGARMAGDTTGSSAALAIFQSIRKHFTKSEIIEAFDAFRAQL